ncbi:MAG: hypothetical protein IPM23_03345 [Candidatus Melainabacteria bacterium]|nr:hypothetical protein [Candidatus Melainabacteria bacterium]
MSKGTSFKRVTVKEDAKTSLAEAGIFELSKLPDGTRIVALGYMYYPHHDRNLVETVLDYLRATKPGVVFLLGGVIDEDAFKAFGEDQDNYLHQYPETAEVQAAMAAGGFEDQVLKLGETCGKFIESIQEASGGMVIYIPSATHLSMSNEVRIMEWIQQSKRIRDSWAVNHQDASDLPSDPSIELPKSLELLFNLHNHPWIRVQPYNSGVLVNGKFLFKIGDFRRRSPGDTSYVDWEQDGFDGIIRSFDGKVSSSWMSRAEHTMPGLQLTFNEQHEVGFLWDRKRMGHLRDYDRRAPGFWTGVVVDGDIFGQSVPIIGGNDGRRSFVVDGVAYTEKDACCLTRGKEIPFGPRDLEKHEHEDPRRIPAPARLEDEGEGEGEDAES